MYRFPDEYGRHGIRHLCPVGTPEPSVNEIGKEQDQQPCCGQHHGKQRVAPQIGAVCQIFRKIVFFDADESFTGKFVDVEIERGETFALYGKRK